MNPKSRWSCIQQACRIPLYTCMHGLAYLMPMKAEWMKLATMAVRPVPGAGFACTCWKLEQSAQHRKQNVDFVGKESTDDKVLVGCWSQSALLVSWKT